tara:strand:- start:178 stop:390 length:213 start_codon:yes stop_codon:yes gene_type:complete
LDNKDLILSKKLISNYKVRLEAEIIKRSKKLRISQQMSEDIITSNCEIKELQKALEQIEGQTHSIHQKEE